VLATLARVMVTSPGEPPLRAAFEDALRAIVPARSIRLCARHGGAAPRNLATDVLAFEVPGADPACRTVLEASFDAGCRVGDWDVQLLGRAANLAAFVLAVERGRDGAGRPGAVVARPARPGGVALVGSTPALQALRETVERVARTDFTILLEGESGVGKELVARLIHDRSARAAGPFVAVNCAALVETLVEAELFGIEERTATGVRGRRGKFEAADGGTVFLDEVSDLSLSAQAKLLRAIQELAVERVGATGAHRVDIRIVAATNRPLRGLIDQGAFRPDLYYRLSGVDLHVPALRERRDDVPGLAEHFLARYQHVRPLTLSRAALEALVAYDWPGNVRELERVVERAVALADGDAIGVDDLPPAVRGEYTATIAPSIERDDTLRTWARRYARMVLDRTGGNKRQAARLLGISVHTLDAYVKPNGQRPTADR
jgi:transcriptional regulator with PAS, ATPase and Fis domain